MTPLAVARIAAFLVLALVLTSLPARVWLLGACPICGRVHEPVLVFHFGPGPVAPVSGHEPADHSHDEPTDPDCFVPLPIGPTPAPSPVLALILACSQLQPQPEPHAIAIPPAALIRPPRA